MPASVLAMREHPGVKVDLLGGRLHRLSQTVTGGDTIAQLHARAAVEAHEWLGIAVTTREAPGDVATAA